MSGAGQRQVFLLLRLVAVRYIAAPDDEQTCNIAMSHCIKRNRVWLRARYIAAPDDARIEFSMMLDTEFTHDNSPVIGVDVAVFRLPGCHTEYDVGLQPSK